MKKHFRTFLVTACVVAAATLALSHGEARAGETPLPPPPSAISPVPAPSGFNSANASSWAAGAHAGYNWQQGTVVFGFETDLQGTHLNSAMNGGLTFTPPVNPFPAGTFAQTTATIDWYGTLRGRAGYAMGPWLFYGTGGLAYGNVSLSSTFAGLGLSTSFLTSSTKTGWTAGAGFEYLFRPNLSFGVLYQYVDLGSLSASSITTGIGAFGPNTISQWATTHAQFQSVMASISWRFAPGPSGPWSGAYVGGQAGGAWGNNASAIYSSTATPVPSDIRLKRDVALVGRRDDGLGLYSFKYLWSDTSYVGVMAQEVALIHPEAVVRDALSGYLAVDYGRLGLSLTTLQ
jgi:outer membrane immunogenic protein